VTGLVGFVTYSPTILPIALQPLFTTESVGHGAGLGLAMVSEFARRAGSSARIESAPNCGTSVILRPSVCRN
jgi:signal transduction histidine kinase